MAVDFASLASHLPRRGLVLLAAMLVVPFASAGGEVQSPAIAIDGLTTVESDWVWARWASELAIGKPTIGGSSEFGIEVWAYDASAPDPVTGDETHNVTRVFTGPATIRHAIAGDGFDVALTSRGNQRIVMTESVVEEASHVASSPGYAGSIPFPTAPPEDALDWKPESTSTVYSRGDIQMRLWEVTLRLQRPDGTTEEFQSGAQAGPAGPLGNPEGGRELLVKIKSGEASVFSAASLVKTMQTGPAAGTIEGRFLLQNGVWSDAADGLAPYVERHEFTFRGANGVTGEISSLVLDKPGGPGLVTRVVDPDPAQVATTSVWMQPPAWLWIVTVASLVLATGFAGLFAVRRRAEWLIEQMRVASVAKEHSEALRLAKRLLRSKHRGEAAAFVVQATLEVRGPAAALEALESRLVIRALDPGMANMMRAILHDELGDADAALRHMDDAYRADPALGGLLGLDLGPAPEAAS